MQIDKDEPTVVFLIGFPSIESIDEDIPGLLAGLTQINVTSKMDAIRQGSRFIVCPIRDELLCIDQNTPCIHLIAYARTMNKQVYVVLDSIQCIVPSLQCVASHIICSASACRHFFNNSCGLWMNIDLNTFELF